jgi:HSP20 family molecular chaperone IbpA
MNIKSCIVEPYYQYPTHEFNWNRSDFVYRKGIENWDIGQNLALYNYTMQLYNKPTKTALVSSVIQDDDNGYVDVEFVVAGYGKEEINVEYSNKDSTIFVRDYQNETICSYQMDDTLSQKINFSQNPTSTLKNGVLKISFRTKQEQKDIKIKID